MYVVKILPLLRISFVSLIINSGHLLAGECPPAFETYTISSGQLFITSNNGPELFFEDSLTETLAAGEIAAIEFPEPNFCGSYHVFSIPCGTMCSRIGLVDCKTGRVFIPDELPTAALSISYNELSSLLIINLPVDIRFLYGETDVPDWLKTEYYVMRDGSFIHLKTAGTSHR